MKRLSDEPGDFTRYLIVISAQAKSAIEKQINPGEKYSNIKVIDAIGLVQSPPEPTDEDE